MSAIRVPLTHRPGKWKAVNGFGFRSDNLADAGNINALRAHKPGADYGRLMSSAITCWNAAIARGFVCC